MPQMFPFYFSLFYLFVVIIMVMYIVVFYSSGMSMKKTNPSHSPCEEKLAFFKKW